MRINFIDYTNTLFASSLDLMKILQLKWMSTKAKGYFLKRSLSHASLDY